MANIDYDSFPYDTYDEYKTWDDSWELIDGIPFAMSPAPYPKHQKVVACIYKLTQNLLHSH